MALVSKTGVNRIAVFYFSFGQPAVAFVSKLQRQEQGRDGNQESVARAALDWGRRRHFHWPPAGGSTPLNGAAWNIFVGFVLKNHFWL